MNIEAFREHCLSKEASIEELPFDEDTLAFKVGGKIFALCSISSYEKGVNLKCDPSFAIELRERYPQVKPGYHMNKLHWNTILPEAGLPEALLCQWINDSYDLVSSKLTKTRKLSLGLL